MFKKICPFLTALPVALIIGICLMPQCYAQQREYKTGMQYKHVESQLPEAANTNNKADNAQSAKTRIYNTNANKPDTGSESDIAKTKQKIWEKYKALAAGTYEENQEKEQSTSTANKAPNKPTKPNEPSSANANTASAEPQKSVGFSGILQEYQRQKARSTQMHSIQVSKPGNGIAKPDTPTVPAPSADK